LLQNLITWLIETIFRLGYPGIVILMAIESSIFPLPSEVVIPPAGVLVAQGRMSAILVIAAGTFGSVIGALANYWLATWLGRPILHRYSKYFLVRESSLDKAEAFFRRHGEISTFVGRLIPVIRHLISLPAGLSRMPIAKFSLYTALGAGIWCSILTGIGWYLGSRFQGLRAEDFQRYSGKAVLIMLPILAVLVGAYIYVQRRRNPSDAERSETA
jgi:membrane protein DedA with SNARE-associated domain